MTKTKAVATVYRVERPDGAGPYNCTDPSWEKLEQEHLSSEVSPKRPSPVTDLHIPAEAIWMDGEMGTHHLTFAFPDKRAEENWFSAKERTWLASQGFVLDAYTVPADRVTASAHQCIFDLPKAKLVGTTSLVGV